MMSSIAVDLNKIRAIVLDVDGVLAPSMLNLSIEGEPLRSINVKDGYALQLAVKRGYKIAVITGGYMPGVKERFVNLGIKDFFMSVSEKLPKLKEWMRDNNIKADEIAYMGDDIPDIFAMRNVGLPCCPNDAAFDVKSESKWISSYPGGCGCVRDLLEQILRCHGDWMSDNDAFGW